MGGREYASVRILDGAAARAAGVFTLGWTETPMRRRSFFERLALLGWTETPMRLRSFFERLGHAVGGDPVVLGHTTDERRSRRGGGGSRRSTCVRVIVWSFFGSNSHSTPFSFPVSGRTTCSELLRWRWTRSGACAITRVCLDACARSIWPVEAFELQITIIIFRCFNLTGLRALDFVEFISAIESRHHFNFEPWKHTNTNLV